jgi:hypothetical protein
MSVIKLWCQLDSENTIYAIGLKLAINNYAKVLECSIHCKLSKAWSKNTLWILCPLRPIVKMLAAASELYVVTYASASRLAALPHALFLPLWQACKLILHPAYM